jgi:hypothetical protein
MPILYQRRWAICSSRSLRNKYSPADDNSPRVAGADTSSITLSFCFWELSQRADIKKKLQIELDEAMLDPRFIPDISILQQLPYMNAFVTEGMLFSFPTERL